MKSIPYHKKKREAIRSEDRLQINKTNCCLIKSDVYKNVVQKHGQIDIA